MHKYSYTGNRSGAVFAIQENIDASYKDLGATCDAIRYKKAEVALDELEMIAEGKKAVYYRRHNKGFGSRHELGGKKGRYPMKAAKIVRRVLVNALANAKNKGYSGEEMVVIHAAANKMQILERSPPKGVLFLGTGISGHTYGYSPARRSNLEYAKVEIVLVSELEGKFNEKAKRMMKKYAKLSSKIKKKESPKAKTSKATKKNDKPKPIKATVTQKDYDNARKVISKKDNPAKTELEKSKSEIQKNKIER